MLRDRSGLIQMDKEQLRRMMNENNLSVDNLARNLDRHPRTIQRWLDGEYSVPRQAAKLIEEMVSKKAPQNTPSTVVTKKLPLQGDEMDNSDYPELDKFVHEIAQTPNDAVDALAVYIYDKQTKKLELDYYIETEVCIEERRPDNEFEINNSSLQSKLEVLAGDIITEGAEGRVNTFYVDDIMVCAMLMDEPVREYGTIQIFVWMNFKGDRQNIFMKNARDYNRPASKAFKEDRGWPKKM